MAGTLKKSGRAAEACLLSPGETGWGIWGISSQGEVLLTGNCANPSEAVLPAKSILALPSREVFAAPLWLATHQESLFREVIVHQLERLGLTGRSNGEMIMDYSLVCKEDSRSLVLAGILPSPFPDALCVENLRHYDVSARMYPLPRDQWTFWLEGERLVFAVTRGEELAYFQALGDRTFTPAVLQEIQCIYFQLEAQKVVSQPVGITLWFGAEEKEKKDLGEAFGIPVTQQTRPSPRLPSRSWQLVPNKVRNIHSVKSEKWKRFQWVASAVAVYFLFLGIFSAQVGWMSWQKWQIQREMKKDAPLIESIRHTAENWKILEPAVNREVYPVELLFQSAKLLPSEGVRFTLFEQDGNKVLITGEAKTASAALKYMDDLKKSESFQSCHWQTPQPRLLPNGSAQFQIEGTRP